MNMRENLSIEAVFNPHSIDYCNDPASQCLALSASGRLVWYAPWQAWMMTQLPDIMTCWKTEYLSSDFYDWEFAPARPAKEDWGNFEKALIGHSLVADEQHHRLIRRVVSPAFSRHVVDEIQRRIEPDIQQLFDRIGQPDYFDFKSAVSEHIPFISITRMIGVPEKYWHDMQPLVEEFTKTWNPTISEQERKTAVEHCNKAIDIIKDIITERRHSPQQDDFLSVMLTIEKEHEHFTEWDIITLILALIGAGSDTTLIAQQWMVYGLLKHKEQIPIAMQTPDTFANAFNEVSRWGIISKMGFARYAPQDIDILGQSVRKGQMVLLMPHLDRHNPDIFPDPKKFDVSRKFDPDILFGYGPRYCIGASLAKRQLYLTVKELLKRFPDVTLAEEPERDEHDHNAIVFKKLTLKTHL